MHAVTITFELSNEDGKEQESLHELLCKAIHEQDLEALQKLYARVVNITK